MIICDLDGTLTLPDNHAFVCMGKTHTKEEILKIMNPVRIARLLPNTDVIKDLAAYSRDGHKIAIITARWNILWAVTIAWLKQYNVIFDYLGMRRHQDFELSSVRVKMGLFEHFMLNEGLRLSDNKFIWIDDDVEMLNEVSKLPHMQCVKVTT